MESGSTVNTVDNNSLPSFGRKEDSRLATVQVGSCRAGGAEAEVEVCDGAFPGTRPLRSPAHASPNLTVLPRYHLIPLIFGPLA